MQRAVLVSKVFVVLDHFPHGAAIRPAPVSYTHLTLPTILLV